MKAKIQTESGEIQVDGDASEVMAVMRLFRQRKRSQTEPQSVILGDNLAIATKYPDWVWGNAHQQRARKAMKELGLSDPKQVVNCPRCGLEIKPAGIYIDGGSWSRVSMHVGGTLCMARQQYGEVDLSDIVRMNLQRLKQEMEAGVRPLCRCGCGNQVQYDPRAKKWYEFYSGHNSSTKKADDERSVLLSDIQDGEFQDDFWKRKRLTSTMGARILRRLEKEGKIERRRALNGGRWTLKLFKVKVTDESVRAGRNAKGV